MTDQQPEYKPWDRMEGEPIRWYGIFIKHYLGTGYARSVSNAYRSCAAEAGPDAAEKATMRRGAPMTWYGMASRWKWVERAQAYDIATSELAAAAIEEAGRNLRLLAVEAVFALKESLKIDRYKVSAAKEILDRAGLPAVSRQEVTNTVTVTSDEMAKAAEEVDKWQTTRQSSSG